MSHHQQLRKGLGRGDLSHVAHTVRYQPEDSPSSNRIMQEWEKHLPLKKAYFTASGIPWKQQLKWADCCTPRRFFVYVAGGCLPAGNLHSPLPLSVYHQLHLWIEPLTRPNPALRGTGTNPMEENKIWVCIRQSKAWSLSTIFSWDTECWSFSLSCIHERADIAQVSPLIFFSRLCHSKTDTSAISSSLHIHLASSSQQGKNLQQCHLPSFWKWL